MSNFRIHPYACTCKFQLAPRVWMQRNSPALWRRILVHVFLALSLATLIASASRAQTPQDLQHELQQLKLDYESKTAELETRLPQVDGASPPSAAPAPTAPPPEPAASQNPPLPN